MLNVSEERHADSFTAGKPADDPIFLLLLMVG